MFELSVFLRDRLMGRSTFTQEEVRIGRNADCEVQLDNLGISRYHASVEAAQGVHVLKDFGSQLGTFVNGQRVKGRCALDDGDRVGVGKYTMIFRCDRQSAAKVDVRDEASYALAGQTLVTTLSPDVSARERTCPFVGHLEVPREKDELVPRVVSLVKDLSVVGSTPGSEVTLPGAPPRAAVIVRGFTGFALVSLGAVKRNGAVVEVRSELANGDSLQFGNVACRFFVARPEAGP